MSTKDLSELLDVLAPLPEAEDSVWLLFELGIRLDEPELIWA